MIRVQSEKLFTEALSYIPGGVNSPVRAFKAVGGKPFFVNKALGSRIWDVDGNEYLDYVGSWGPAILGHAHPKIVSAIKAVVENGTSFGIPNPYEVTMAKWICALVPSVQKVRMTNSGTEACMSAIRLARGLTRRDKILKFEGCYHGHSDSVLVKAGSGGLTFGSPDSAGVPASFAQQTIVVPYNNTHAVRDAFAANKKDIAAIIVEPVPGNAGLFLPKPGYLEFLRETANGYGALLIFDEVMTGFRLARGGAQERFGVKPDLTCFGKIIGGGLPVGAFGGRADIMDCLAPIGPVYPAGTLSGNPLAMAAGIVTLEELNATIEHPSQPASQIHGNPPGVAPKSPYEYLEKRGEQLAVGLREAAKHARIPFTLNSCGSMFGAYFTDQPVHDLDDAMRSNQERFKKFFHGMLEQNFYFAPSPFEAGFVSMAHSIADVSATVNAAEKVMKKL